MRHFLESIRRNTNYERFIVLLLLVTIGFYIFLSFFSVPSADDFSQASLSSKEGIFGYVVWRYLNWSGRYSSDIIISTYNFLGSKVDNYFLIDFYYIVPIFLIIFYLLSSYLFISLLSLKNDIIWKCIFALVSTIFMLSGVELRSTIFWLAGGTTYTLGNALFLISLGLTLFTVYIDGSSRRNNLLIFLNIGLIFLVNGFNEVLMVSNTVFITALLLLSSILKNLRKNEYLKLLYFEISTVISATIVFLAPGNRNRSSQDAQEIGVVKALTKSFFATLDNIFDWINPVWICLLLLISFILYHLISLQTEGYIRNQKKFFSTIISLAIALYTSYFARYYSLGNQGPLRANSTSHVIFFIITSFLCLYAFIRFDFYNFRSMVEKQKKMVVSIFILFCFLAIFTNFELLMNDLSILKSHYSYYQTVYPKLTSGNFNDTFEVQPEPRVFILRWKCYLTDDREYWTNTAMAKYFNVKSITAVGGGAPDPDCGDFESYQKPE